MGDWLDHKQSLGNQAGTNLRHIRDRELSRRNCLRRPASFKVGDLVFVHHSHLPSWPRNCLYDHYFGPYRIIRIDGSRIHVRCSPRLGGELLCAPEQLRHYHSPDDLSWDEWRCSDSEVERIDLESAASPEEADELEKMTADDMAVDGYYVVAGTSCNVKGGIPSSRRYLPTHLHRRTGPLAPRDNHSLAEGHWFLHRLLLTEHCTDPVCALQTHAYGFQRGPGGRLSGLQPPSECMPC